MEAYKASKIEFLNIYQDDLLKLNNEALFKIGEFKYALKTLKFDYNYFLDITLDIDSAYSLSFDEENKNIEDVFYIGYMKDKNNKQRYMNYKKTFLYAYKYLNNNGVYSKELFNSLHKMLVGKTKKVKSNEIGKYRTKQAYVMKMGLVGKEIDYIPVNYKDIKDLMNDYFNYLNMQRNYPLIEMAIMNYQFETIHPYMEANGRLSRIMIPIHFNNYFNMEPIIFISKSLYKNKNTYFRLLNEARNGNIKAFVKFFLTTIIEMCNSNIKMIEELNNSYKEDLKYAEKEIGGTLIYKVIPYMQSKPVFTINDLVKNLKLHINSVNKVLNNLIKIGLVEKEKKDNMNRVTFKYINACNIYLNN